MVLGVLSMPFIISSALQCFQLYLHASVEMRMEEKESSHFSFPLTQIRWVKQEKEFIVNGKFYDIKTYSVTNNILYATGFCDTEETAASAFMLWLMDEYELIYKFLLSYFNVFITVLISVYLIASSYKYHRNLFGFKQKKYLSFILSILAPPPKAA